MSEELKPLKNVRQVFRFARKYGCRVMQSPVRGNCWIIFPAVPLIHMESGQVHRIARVTVDKENDDIVKFETPQAKETAEWTNLHNFALPPSEKV